MAIQLADLAKQVQKDIRAYYAEREQYAMQQAVHPQIVTVNTSPPEGAFDRGNALGSLGELDEVNPGEKGSADNLVEGYEWIAKDRYFKKHVAINEAVYKNATRLGSLISALGPMWADAWTNTLESIVAKVFNLGGKTAGDAFFNNTIAGVVTDSSGNLIYDGKPYFALSGNGHPGKVTGTYVNAAALSLTKANAETVHIAFTNTNAKDERGNLVSIQPDTVIVPPALEFSARQIFENPMTSGTANNDVNFMNGKAKVIVWRNITTASEWIYGKRLAGGIELQIVQAPTPMTYVEPMTETIFVYVKGIVRIAVKNWRDWYGNNVPTS